MLTMLNSFDDMTYNKEILISELKRYYAEYGVPTARGLKRTFGYPGYDSYLKYFGSLENALKEAGIFEKLNTDKYTDEQLIDKLKEYVIKYGKVPTQIDIDKNPGYPSVGTYQRHFGSWNNALKAAGLDFDSMLEKGEAKLECCNHKGRLGEIIVKNSFKSEGVIDLSGQNWKSIFDGICPKGFAYDVKTSSLKTRKGTNIKEWIFYFNNKEVEKIEYFFLLGLNEDFTKLLHAWMIHLELLICRYKGKSHILTEKSIPFSEYGLRKWKKYEVTDGCLDVGKLMDKLMKQGGSNGIT